LTSEKNRLKLKELHPARFFQFFGLFWSGAITLKIFYLFGLFPLRSNQFMIIPEKEIIPHADKGNGSVKLIIF
ncbi:hypothetical protein DU176_22400, partial [Salmonella enterica subsp. enterica serovar Poona]|nr:hypothetical protein [Salmonella enterica]EBY1911286.1 hypothetical protein [Salmonella enterica subsp. enterica serovar Poona]EBZ9451475.1 hypothetical protein [Salmonella enterica subsp. enterica serovar Poona]